MGSYVLSTIRFAQSEREEKNIIWMTLGGSFLTLIFSMVAFLICRKNGDFKVTPCRFDLFDWFPSLKDGPGLTRCPVSSHYRLPKWIHFPECAKGHQDSQHELHFDSDRVGFVLYGGTLARIWCHDSGSCLYLSILSFKTDSLSSIWLLVMLFPCWQERHSWRSLSYSQRKRHQLFLKRSFWMRNLRYPAKSANQNQKTHWSLRVYNKSQSLQLYKLMHKWI